MSLYHVHHRTLFRKLTFAMILPYLHHHFQSFLLQFTLVICIQITLIQDQTLSHPIFVVIYFWCCAIYTPALLSSTPIEKNTYFLYLYTSHFIRETFLHHATTIDATVAAIFPTTLPTLTPPLPICTSTPFHTPIGVCKNSRKSCKV